MEMQKSELKEQSLSLASREKSMTAEAEDVRREAEELAQAKKALGEERRQLAAAREASSQRQTVANEASITLVEEKKQLQQLQSQLASEQRQLQEERDMLSRERAQLREAQTELAQELQALQESQALFAEKQASVQHPPHAALVNGHHSPITVATQEGSSQMAAKQPEKDEIYQNTAVKEAWASLAREQELLRQRVLLLEQERTVLQDERQRQASTREDQPPEVQAKVRSSLLLMCDYDSYSHVLACENICEWTKEHGLALPSFPFKLLSVAHAKL